MTPDDLELVTRWTPDGRLRHVSASVLPLLGYEPAQVVGHPIFEFLHPDDHEYVRRRHAELAAGRGSSDDITLHRYRCRDGSYRWLEATVRVHVDDDGNITEISSTARDASRRVSAERALAESEARFRSAFDGAPIGMAIVDLDGRFLRVNRSLCASSGYSEDQLRELRFQDITHPDDVTEEQTLAALLLTGSIDSYQLEKRYTGLDGRTIWVQLASSLIRDEDGQPVHFVVQVQDITARREVEQQLLREREEAERANQAKTEFLSRLSHELRTPLNAVLGFAQVLQRSNRLDPDDAGHVEHVVAAGRHLAEIINDLVDSSRVEQGRLHASAEPVDVDMTVEAAASLIRSLGEERGVRVSLTAGGHTVLADPRRFRQVLVNLLSNAVKYNRRGGWVQVRSEPASEGRIRIEVRDSGIGIRDDALRKVFQPFVRLAADREVDGSGLGLAVTAAFVEAMGGEIEVESTEGVGSTFSVLLPTVPSSTPTPEPVGDRRRVPRRRCRHLRILHVEDRLVNRQLMREMLATPGNIEVDEAATVADALARVRARRPDMILLDLNLPRRNGETLLDDLTLDDRTRDIPVIVVSASADEGTVHRLLDRGVRAYLTKPVELGVLLHTIETVCHEHTAAMDEHGADGH